MIDENNIVLQNLTQQDIPQLVAIIKKQKHFIEEHQSLDGLQQMQIEKLNQEINRLRESIIYLEDQYRRSLATTHMNG